MKITVSYRIEEEIVKKLKKLAEKENRKIGNYVETILLKHIEETKQTEKP